MANKDLDIESYHNPLEPEEQWEMKRKFMEAHKESFDEERLVCLAQVLINVEFLGCRSAFILWFLSCFVSRY